MGTFLTCPQPPCGPGQCSCFIPREQQAATSCRGKAIFLVLSWLLAFSSQAVGSFPATCTIRAIKQTLFQSQPRWAPTTEGWLGCKALVQRRYKHGFDCKWTQPWWCHLTGTGHVITILLWDLSQRLQFTNRFICFIVYINPLFVGKVTALLCLPEYRFLLGNHWKAGENVTFGNKITQGNCQFAVIQ